MAPLRRSREQVQEGEDIFAWMMHRCKKPVNRYVVKFDGGRRWDEMPHDILVDIMKRLGHFEKTYTLSLMCKSWLSALLDSLFPPGDVLDLRLFDKIPDKYGKTRRVYGNYLMMVLNHRQYSKVFLPKRLFKKELYEDIAKRLPALKCVVVDRYFIVDALNRLAGMFLYWPKLMEAHCHACLVTKIAVHCKDIRKLWVYGWIRDDGANWIANELPQLEYLDIQSCVLSARALAIILDGQKELKHLDTRHVARFDDKFLSQFSCNPFGKAIDWNEEEIHAKVAAAGINTYLECPRKCCPDCSIFYDSSVSPLGLRAWRLYGPHDPGLCLTITRLARGDHQPWSSSTLPPCPLFNHELGLNFRPILDDSHSLVFWFQLDLA